MIMHVNNNYNPHSLQQAAPLAPLDYMSYDDSDNSDQSFEYHLAYTHRDLENAGAPTRPLEFPHPLVFEGEVTNLLCAEHQTGSEFAIRNVLVKKVPGGGERAYLIKKKLAHSTYGSVRLGVVLRRLPSTEAVGPLGAQWQSTDELVAIKISSWDKMRRGRGRNLVDPIKEISVLQHYGQNDQHVLGCLDVLQDAEYLYTVMPYCAGGDLYGKLTACGELQLSPGEDAARHYFRQILSALQFLQRKGVCHRNICLENLLLDDDENLNLIDGGLGLRVPYCDPYNYENVTDVSGGAVRRLMKPQGQCGKLMYLAPEVIEQRPFDGHATDLWAAGIVLFTILMGVEPFQLAQPSDGRFYMISQQGRLPDFLNQMGVSLSAEATDLLQNLLWYNPLQRLTLADVLEHPWVRGQIIPTMPMMSGVPPTPAPLQEKFRCEPLHEIPEDDEETESTVGIEAPKEHLKKEHLKNILPETEQPLKRKKSSARAMFGKLKCAFPRRYGVGPNAIKAHSLPKSQTSEVT